jgi:hypothetical protein
MAAGVTRIRCGRILESINDQEKTPDVGRYAGWGSGEDLHAKPARDRFGPSLIPLAYGATRRWGRTLGLLYIPAVIVLITLEIDVLHLPASAVWVSLVGLFVAFVLVGRWLDRRAT